MAAHSTLTAPTLAGVDLSSAHQDGT